MAGPSEDERRAQAAERWARYQERMRADPALAERRREQARAAEARRRAKLAAAPESDEARARQAHDSRPRPGRKDTRGARPGRARGRPSFVIAPIDGEGFEWSEGQRYGLLYVLGRREPLCAAEGLGTQRVLDWLLSLPSNWALLGFALTYDVEHWLRDLSDEAYLALTNGGQEITWRGTRLRWIPGKILSVQRGRVRREVMDAWGYYQSSLLSALGSYGIPAPQEVSAGKAGRGGFLWDALPEVRDYAAAEAVAARHLHEALRRDVDEGLAAIGMRPLGRRELYGPGAIARRLLHDTKWRQEHPLHPEGTPLAPAVPRAFWDRPECRRWNPAQAERFPFSAASAGGRIEAAALGEWPEVEDWDLHSAYPCALSRLPAWRPEAYRWIGDAAEAEEALRREPVGMYLVRWALPPGWDWYPCPYRSPAGNLCWPRTGMGWLMSPEVHAMADTCPSGTWALEGACVLHETEGWGTGLCPGPAPGALPAALVQAYAVRERLVVEGRGGQKGIKLLLNGCSGKLIQQVGRTPEKPGDFSDVAAAWYTSWTRAMVWRAIAQHGAQEGGRVLAIQTDGIVALPGALSPQEGPGMGEWERATWRGYRQYGAGLYTAAEGLRRMRRRGFPEFDPQAAWDVVRGAAPQAVSRYRLFVGRRHALAQPDLPCWTPGHEGAPDTTLGQSRFQWRELQRAYTPSLGSKREEPWRAGIPASWSAEKTAAAGAAWRRQVGLPVWCPPKTAMDWAGRGLMSQPYRLRWRRAEDWVAPAEVPEGQGDALSPAEEARLEDALPSAGLS